MCNLIQVPCTSSLRFGNKYRKKNQLMSKSKADLKILKKLKMVG